MAYQAPAFCFLHAARLAGAGLTASSEANGFPVARLADDRRGPLFKWASAAAGNYVQVDRGAGSLEAIDRVLIPANHNLAGQAWTIKTSATGAFAGEESTRVSVASQAVGLIDEDFDASTTHRYVRLFVPSFQGQLSELFLTRTRAPARGPEPSWVDDPVGLSADTELASGLVLSVSRGEARRDIRIALRRLSSTDLGIVQDLLVATAFGLQRFYFQPPDSEALPAFVRLVGPVGLTQDREIPAGPLGPAYSATINMQEVAEG